ncbi:MAG: cache domain-containing protein [Victivallaceae bacterium]|nr:cache domain-containing protein [Victivallaceae bacterium]
MKKKVSLIKLIRFWSIILLLAIATVISTIDITANYHSLSINTKKIRADYLKAQQENIRHEVGRVIDMIRYERKQCTILAQEQVKQRVYEACAIAENIYEVNKNSKSADEIKRMIVDAISPIRFPASGYYFIASLTGDNILLNNMPDMTGKKLLETQDLDGRYVVKDIIAIAKRSGEGFYKYTWMKPNQKISLAKSSFVKLFKPYNWIIGAGLYIDDVETMVKEKVMKRINDIRFGTNGYIFVGDWQGIVLAHGAQPKLIGSNMWNSKDSKGNKVNQIFIAASKQPNGGYINYWWREPGKSKARPKIAFTKGVPAWKLFVGAGVYLDDIDTDIAAMHNDLNNQTKQKVIIFIIITALVVAIIIFLIDLLSRKLNNDFNIYSSSFAKAASSDEEIDHAYIRFAELDKMARYANKMLQDKIAVKQHLLTEKEHLEVTLRSISEGVITIDSSSRVLTMNDAAAKLTGWHEQQATGKIISDIFNITNGDHKNHINEIVNKVLTTGQTVEHTNHNILISKAGIKHNIAANAAPLRDLKNNIHGIVIVFKDITARLKREEERLKANKLESIGILAGGIAHNFNNILTGIFGNIEFAKAKLPGTHQAYKFINTAHHAMERATELTKQLLTFAKGGDPLIESLKIQDVINNALEFNLSGSNVKAKLNLPDELWQIKADKGQLNQIFSNLIINAKHAMPDGGNIYIEAENCPSPGIPNLSGDFIKITVKDDGVGIPAKFIKQIFDPYFTTKQTGSGLGLATVHSIISRHNGHIAVESTPQIGTVFTIHLPSVKTSPRQEESATVSSIEHTSPMSAHILLMDDEKMILDVSSTLLESCGYQVEIATDGKDALKKYRSATANGQPFDLVIMDLTIPGGMGGKETIRKLLAFAPSAKVIASSGYSTDPVIANYKKYGFKGQLIKPFRLEVLKAEVARLLNEN